MISSFEDTFKNSISALFQIREILNDFSNGLLIDYNDIKKSAQLILKYIDDLDTQKKNINDSMNFILENFNNEIFTQKIKSLISKV